LRTCENRIVELWCFCSVRAIYVVPSIILTKAPSISCNEENLRHMETLHREPVFSILVFRLNLILKLTYISEETEESIWVSKRFPTPNAR